ncbi:hypothetical protein MWMV1_MWMV1_02320 [Acinetobacter baumannii]|nr:hypothetical protein MWMV6_MWMV6_02320 [Acinetobacter baumannii]CAI4176647.1 hypothetical protein MWMV1_MWMV1_02320 [Acinetobacter baumannii]
MAVPEQTPFIEYTANGTTTVFPVPFQCDKAEYLIVKVNDLIQLLGTWSLIDGSVVFNTAPLNESIVTIQRSTKLSRTTDYNLYDNSFRPEPVNYDFDNIWRVLQEVAYQFTIAENKFQDLIDQLVEGNINGLPAEILARIAGDQANNQLISQEIARAYFAEKVLEIAIKAEEERAKSSEDSLQLQITTSNAGIKYFSTEAELLAFVPTTTDPKQAYAFDTKKNYLWVLKSGSTTEYEWKDEGKSQLTLAEEFTLGKIESLSGDKPQAYIKDNKNYMLAAFEAEQATIANIDILKANIPSLPLVFIGEDSFTLVPLPEEPPETQNSSGSNALIDLSNPTLNSLIVGWADKPYQLYVPQLFNDRVLIGNQKSVKASFISKTLPYSKQSNELLDIDLSKVGPTAQIMFRNDSEYTKRTLIDLNIKSITSGTANPKILMIGDSITWNGATNIAHDALVEHGYAPTFIGTLDKYSTEPPISINDYLHEGHSGWETGDFTNYINDRSQPVAVGDEAKYLAAQAPYQLKNDFNPFIRAATGSDDPTLVRNGYIFDAVFYRDRFGFANDVDCIYIATGTNDLRDRTDSTLIPIYESEMKIMIDSLKIAFPNAAIVLCVPNTSNTAGRNNLWNKYYRLLRSAMNIAKTRNAERIYFAPVHAMTCPEVGYLHDGATDSISGAVTGSFTDEIHPYYASRIQTWYQASAYAAAAKNGVI